MEELDSMWDYQEDFDQIKLRLQFTTLELESLKMEANEQKRKHSEEMLHLQSLIKLAYNERNESRQQLQMLINKLNPNPLSENPMLIAPKANSSITESNSLTEAHNHQHSHCSSSPMDTLFDTVTSPDFSAMKITADPCRLMVPIMAHIDSATAVIDGIAKGRTLPQKGDLLQAVLDSGPLLQTLIVAGPLPRWRNPPLLQSFKTFVNALNVPEMLANLKQANPCSAPLSSFPSSVMLNTGAGSVSPIIAVKRQKVSMV